MLKYYYKTVKNSFFKKLFFYENIFLRKIGFYFLFFVVWYKINYFLQKKEKNINSFI